MNDELWRVQLGTGEVRMMTLDGLDRAFDEGLIDANAPVLAPGSMTWTTLGQAAGLDDQGTSDQTPSLSPVAISSASPTTHFTPPTPAFDLDLPDSSMLELRPRRRGLLFGGIAAALVAAAALAVVVGKVGSAVGHDVKATSAMQAPAAAAPLPPPDPAKDARPALNDDQKKKLLDADKAREDKARVKNQEKAEKAERVQKRKPSKTGPVFVNSGDKYDPLNGHL